MLVSSVEPNLLILVIFHILTLLRQFRSDGVLISITLEVGIQVYLNSRLLLENNEVQSYFFYMKVLRNVMIFYL